MLLKFWGVRGSRPTHKKSLLGFGGNSTCLEFCVEDTDFNLFLDGGSGLAWRGHSIPALNRIKKYHFLVTHTHWDHILGYPFFSPIYHEHNQFNFYASNTTRSSFTELFFGLQRLGNLPVPVSALKAKINFQTVLPQQPFSIEGKVEVDTYQLNHQGVTLGYKLKRNQASVCIITDNAPIENGNYLGEGMRSKAQTLGPQVFEDQFNEGLVNFLKDTHTVVFDTHFMERDLKPDWGHSSPEKALNFCAKAKVKRLILFHHAPEDQDSAVLEKVNSIKNRGASMGIDVVPAKEGEEWDLCG